MARPAPRRRSDLALLLLAALGAGCSPSGSTPGAPGNLLVNPGFEAFFEWSREQALGQTALDLGLWADEGERRRMQTEFERSGKVRNFEARARTRSGASKACLVSAEKIEFSGGTRLIHVVHDVTDRVAAENARRASEEQVRLLLAHAHGKGPSYLAQASSTSRIAGSLRA